MESTYDDVYAADPKMDACFSEYAVAAFEFVSQVSGGGCKPALRIDPRPAFKLDHSGNATSARFLSIHIHCVSVGQSFFVS